MPIITIDQKSFLKGISQSNYAPDGGYSNDSGAFEPARTDELYGLLNPGTLPTEYSTNIDAEICAMRVIPNASGNDYYYSILSNKKLVETNPAANTHTVKLTGATGTYTTGISDLCKYNGWLFISSDTDIWQESMSSFANNDTDWWTNTLGKTALTSGVPHLLFEFQNIMYITNGNQVWSFDGTTGKTTGSGTLTLDSAWKIIDYYLSDDTIHLICKKGSQYKIFKWDSFSPNYTGEATLNITGFIGITDLQGIKYFGSRGGLYAFDGFNYSRKKHFFNPNSRQVLANKDDVLYFGYGTSLMAYYPKFNAIYKKATFNNPITIVKAGTENTTSRAIHVVTYSATSSKYYELTSSFTTSTLFYSNYMKFERPAIINKVEITFYTPLQSGGDYTLYFYNQVGTILYQKQFQYSDSDVGAVTKYIIPINKHVEIFRLGLLFNASTCRPVQEIKIYWSPSERSNKLYSTS